MVRKKEERRRGTGQTDGRTPKTSVGLLDSPIPPPSTRQGSHARFLRSLSLFALPALPSFLRFPSHSLPHSLTVRPFGSSCFRSTPVWSLSSLHLRLSTCGNLDLALPLDSTRIKAQAFPCIPAPPAPDASFPFSYSPGFVKDPACHLSFFRGQSKQEQGNPRPLRFLKINYGCQHLPNPVPEIVCVALFFFFLLFVLGLFGLDAFFFPRTPKESPCSQARYVYRRRR